MDEVGCIRMREDVYGWGECIMYMDEVGCIRMREDVYGWEGTTLCPDTNQY